MTRAKPHTRCFPLLDCGFLFLGLLEVHRQPTARDGDCHRQDHRIIRQFGKGCWSFFTAASVTALVIEGQRFEFTQPFEMFQSGIRDLGPIEAQLAKLSQAFEVFQPRPPFHTRNREVTRTARQTPRLIVVFLSTAVARSVRADRRKSICKFGNAV